MKLHCCAYSPQLTWDHFQKWVNLELLGNVFILGGDFILPITKTVLLCYTHKDNSAAILSVQRAGYNNHLNKL